MKAETAKLLGVLSLSLLLSAPAALAGDAGSPAPATPDPSAPRASLGERLVGTWRLVSVEDRKDAGDPASEWTRPYGPNPKGYIVYDRAGHVSVHVMSNPAPPRFASAEAPTREELAAVQQGYAGYFGTYTVDEAQSTVTHHVEGASLPDYVGTDQLRPIRLSGDRLEIGDGKTWRRVLQRVR